MPVRSWPARRPVAPGRNDRVVDPQLEDARVVGGHVTFRSSTVGLQAGEPSTGGRGLSGQRPDERLLAASNGRLEDAATCAPARRPSADPGRRGRARSCSASSYRDVTASRPVFEYPQYATSGLPVLEQDALEHRRDRLRRRLALAVFVIVQTIASPRPTVTSTDGPPACDDVVAAAGSTSRSVGSR